MKIPTLAQCFGTEKLNKQHGPHYTTAYMLYSTRLQDGVSSHQCSVEVAELLELDVSEVKEWARLYDWNRQIAVRQMLQR